MMTCPARDTVQAFAAAGMRAYEFLFARAPGNASDSAFVLHASDIPYMFDSQSLLALPGDRSVGAHMSRLWMNFVQSGSPNVPVEPAVPWPAHNATGSTTRTMRLDVQLQVQDDLRSRQCNYWTAVLRKHALGDDAML